MCRRYLLVPPSDALDVSYMCGSSIMSNENATDNR